MRDPGQETAHGLLSGVGFRQAEGRQRKPESRKITKSPDSEKGIEQLMRSNDKKSIENR